MMTKLGIQYDPETIDSSIQDVVIPSLGAFEKKTFGVISSDAKGPLIYTSKSEGRHVQTVPALNLMRCSSFEGDIDWVDSFLWLVDDTYKTLSMKDQKTISENFLVFVQKSTQFHTRFVEKMQKYPEIVEKFAFTSAEDTKRILKDLDILPLATLVALLFGYSLHVFSLIDTEFFEPSYLTDLVGQDKKPALFMICAADGHYEPLFQLTTDTFGAEFDWTDTTLCSIKDVCNQYVDPDYELPNDCELVPSGTTLDSVDEWISYFFSTRISDEEQPVIDDSKSYPIPRLSTQIVSRLPDGTKKVELLPRQVAIQAKIDTSGWGTAKTVGDGTCMLHAFLQSTSEVYRKIPHNERNLVGQWFRTAVLLPQYPTDDEDYAVAIARVSDMIEFLEQDDLQKLVDTFQINIVVLTTTGNLLLIIKPMKGFQAKPYIFMVNNDEDHYSSIYLGKQGKFMLSEAEMRSEYPEIVEEMYKDVEYEDVRREVVDFVRETGAPEKTKDDVVQNIFRHIRPQEGQADPTPPDKHARLLEGSLNKYAAYLRVPTTNFNQFRQRLRNTTRGGRRRIQKNDKSRKTLKARS
jgi:hypothetical protein